MSERSDEVSLQWTVKLSQLQESMLADIMPGMHLCTCFSKKQEPSPGFAQLPKHSKIDHHGYNCTGTSGSVWPFNPYKTMESTATMLNFALRKFEIQSELPELQ
jgi:hypothetical protein